MVTYHNQTKIDLIRDYRFFLYENLKEDDQDRVEWDENLPNESLYLNCGPSEIIASQS